MCQEIFDNENQTEFFKLNFNPLELKFVRFFGMFLCKIEWSSFFKKSGPKICFSHLKRALRVEHSYMVHSPMATLFHIVRKRLTSDLLNGSCLTSVRKKLYNAMSGWGRTDRASIPHSLNLITYPLCTLYNNL